MYFILGNREQLGRSLPRQKIIAELGVCKGNNAQFLLAHHAPEELHLVDSWSAEAYRKSYYILEPLPSFVQPLETHAFYYNGNPLEQKTYDALYDGVKERFAGNAAVSLIRKETHHAVKDYPDGYFDMIYLDAAHQYSYVQRDLFNWKDKLKPEGFLVLNDCASSPQGRAQNLGVLEAITNFIKATEFRPIAITNSPFADLVLSRMPFSPPAQQLRQALMNDSSIYIIELPDEMLHSYSHKLGQRVVNGAPELLIVPSFKL